MEIRVEIKDDEVRSAFARLAASAKDLTPAMREIGEIVRSSVVRNFEAGGRPERWQPNAAATVLKGLSRRHSTKRGALKAGAARRLARGKVLIDTGRLVNSISPQAYTDRVIVGTNVQYARIHQLGGKAGRGRKVKIPARPYLMVQDEDWSQILATLRRHLGRGGRHS